MTSCHEVFVGERALAEQALVVPVGAELQPPLNPYAWAVTWAHARHQTVEPSFRDVGEVGEVADSAEAAVLV